MSTLTVQPEASADDAVEQFSTGNTTLTDTTSIIQGNHHTAWRFPSVTIAQGATINSATLRFDQLQDNANSDLGEVVFYGNDVDNAAQFTTDNSNISGKTRTTASIAPTDSTTTFWVTTGLNVTGIVQEIIDRGGWSSGNALALLCIGSGGSYRHVYPYAYDFSDNSKRARLTIDYTAGGSASDIKKMSGVAQASLKKVSGVALASVKVVSGVSNV